MNNIEIVEYPKINGLYKHYKGGEYVVFSMATHTETEEKMVLYKSILFGSIYARPLSVWNEKVKVDGEMIERFQYQDLSYENVTL